MSKSCPQCGAPFKGPDRIFPPLLCSSCWKLEKEKPIENKANSIEIDEDKIPSGVHLLCGWSLALLFLGGVLGFIFAICSYLVNIKIYKSRLPRFLVWVLILMTGVFAITIWIIIGALLSMAVEI